MDDDAITPGNFVAAALELAQGTPASCRCIGCKNACATKPGWFAPGEPEALAKALGITFEELFETKLMVDSIDVAGERVFVLSPAIVGFEGKAAPSRPGECVFLDADDLCSIHQEGKPAECAAAFHGYGYGFHAASHLEIGAQWAPYQSALIRSCFSTMATEMTYDA